MKPTVEPKKNLYDKIKGVSSMIVMAVLFLFTIKYFFLVKAGVVGCSVEDTVLLSLGATTVVAEVSIGIYQGLIDKGIISG